MNIMRLLLSIFFMFASCTYQDYDKGHLPVEMKRFVNDTTFLNHYMEYYRYVINANSHESDDLYIYVNYLTINDSIYKISFLGVTSPELFEDNLPQDIFYLNNHAVFFNNRNNKNLRKDDIPNSNSSINYEKFMKDFFPKAFMSYKKYGYIYPQVCFEPKIMHLYYLNDSLIHSVLQGGRISDKCNMMLNGRVIWM